MSETGSADAGADPRVFINSQGDLARTVDPVSLFGLLADDVRRRTFSAVDLGARSVRQIAEMISQTERDVAEALHRLQTSGLVYRDREGYRVDVDLLREVARASNPKPRRGGDEFADQAGERRTILRTFIQGGRLATMPAAAAKREVVLEHIATVFEPGVRYAEKEVNAILRSWFDDYASLRRYLVDAGLLSREANVYWRSGGWVDTLR